MMTSEVEYRVYEKEGFKCITVCDKTKIKVGSAQCEKYCVYFLAHDCDLQEVTCRSALNKS
jgi:hypothetical protein